MALLGFVERIFAMCLHVALSLMVLISIVNKRPIWYWIALSWHAFVDAAAVYLGQQISMLGLEGIVGVFAVISLILVIWLRLKIASSEAAKEEGQLVETVNDQRFK
jgi:uncharacterized membrane protein YhfC